MPTSDEINSVFRLVDREVWIVTAADEERRGGLVATWVSQASIDPDAPIVIIAIAKNHFTRELVKSSGAFALHLITADQSDLAWNFCIGSGRDRDKFAEVPYRLGKTDSPILEECLAWLECRVFYEHEVADRAYFWGDVLTGGRAAEGKPLCEQELFALADEEEKADLHTSMISDIQFQREMIAQWRQQMAKKPQ